MTVEGDAEHVVALSLHPVGAAIERRERGATRDAGPELGPQRDGESGTEILYPAQYLEAAFLPVDRRQEVEVETARVVLQDARGLEPALRRDREDQVRRRAGGIETEALADDGADVDRPHCSTGSAFPGGTIRILLARLAGDTFEVPPFPVGQS